MPTGSTGGMTDAQLGEFLYYRIRLPGSVFLCRDWDLEDMLERAGRIEFILEHSTREQAQEWYRMLGTKQHEAQLRGRLPGPSARSVQLHHLGPGLGRPFRLPSKKIDAVCEACKLEFPDAVELLSEVLADELKCFGSDRWRAGANVIDFRAYGRTSERIWYSVKGGALNFSVLPLYTERARILLPGLGLSSRSLVLFPSTVDHGTLYNQAQLWDGPDEVLVTDSLVIAHAGNPFGRAPEDYPFLWTSWYGGARNVAEVDWSPLKGKRIRYLVLDHSGMAVQQAYETALLAEKGIREQLRQKVTFVCYLEGPGRPASTVSLMPHPPIVLGPEDLKAYVSKLSSQPLVLPWNSSSLSTPVGSPFPRRRKRLFDPFASEGTATLIYGGEGVGKSLLALSMAKCAFYGTRLCGSWRSRLSTNVVYIASDSPLSPFTSTLDAVFGEDGWESGIDDGGSFATPTQTGQESDGTALIIRHFQKGSLGMELPEQGLQWAEFVEKTLPPSFGVAPLVVLDGMFWLTTLRTLPFGLTTFLRRMRAIRGAVLVVVGTSGSGSKHIGRIRDMFPWDSVIEVKARRSGDAAAVGMSVRIEKGFALRKEEPRLLKLGYCSTDQSWELVGRKRTPLDELEKVLDLLLMGKTQQQIALDLGITVSQAKRRRDQLRGAAPLNQSIAEAPFGSGQAKALIARYQAFRADEHGDAPPCSGCSPPVTTID